MQHKTVIFATRSLTLLFVSVLLATCSSGGSQEPYTIGLPISLTGKNATNGQNILNSVKMRVEEINEKGGVAGHPLALKVLDNKSDPNVSRANLATLKQDASVLAIIGHPRRTQGVPDSVVIFNTAFGEVSEEDKEPNPWVFSSAYSLEHQQRVLAAYIRSFEPSRNVVVINAEGAGSVQAADLFESLATKAQLKVTRLNISNPDEVVLATDDALSVVLFAAEDRYVDFVRAIRKVDAGVSIYGDYQIGDAVEKHSKEPFAANVFSCVPFSYRLSRLEAVQFRQRYEEIYGASPIQEAAFAYDATGMIADTLAKSKTPTRTSVREALAKRKSTETGFSGITGRLFFDATQRTDRNVIIKQVFDKVSRPSFRQLKIVPSNFAHDKEHKIVEVDGHSYFVVTVAYIGVDFSRLENMDALKDEINISGFMWLKWQGDLNPELVDLQNAAAPTTRVKIKEGRFEEELHALPPRRQAKDGTKETPIMYAAYKIKLPVQYEFKLADFPFDSQTFPVTIGSAGADNNRLAFVVESDFISEKMLVTAGWTQIRRQDYTASFSEESSLGAFLRADRASHQRTKIASYEILVEFKRVVFGYLFSLFVPVLACIMLCFLAFYIKMDDVNARLALVTGAFFVAMLSHTSLRGTLGVSYLVAADLFYFIVYCVVVVAIVGVNIVEHSREKNAQAALRVQRITRRTVMFGSLFAFGGLAVKLIFFNE